MTTGKNRVNPPLLTLARWILNWRVSNRGDEVADDLDALFQQDLDAIGNADVIGNADATRNAAATRNPDATGNGGTSGDVEGGYRRVVGYSRASARFWWEVANVVLLGAGKPIPPSPASSSSSSEEASASTAATPSVSRASTSVPAASTPSTSPSPRSTSPSPRSTSPIQWSTSPAPMSSLVSPMMYVHYLKTALRKAERQKGYSIINLFGLVVGLASFMVIMLYVTDEYSHDAFHSDADRIYRLAYHQAGEGYDRQRLEAPGALKDAIISDIPDVELATSLFPSYWGKALLSNAHLTYYDNKLLFVDDTFLDVFSFPAIDGVASRAFDQPASIVLTRSLAQRFFPAGDAMGQTLLFNKNQPLTVTAVIEDVPANSHLEFDFLVSRVAANRPAWETNWDEGHMRTYVKVRAGADVPGVVAKIQSLVDTNHRAYMERLNATETYRAEPVAGPNGIHLSQPGNKLYVRVLLLVAFFILLIAGINYVNLATARSATRAKEIGVRKVTGALRKTLINQFLAESMLTVAVAAVLAVCLAAAVLPFFNNVMDKDLAVFAAGGSGLGGDRGVWGQIALSVLLFGLAAGTYPAFYLSSLNPISAFRSQSGLKRSGIGLRKTLVILQFGLSAFLLVGVIVVREQLAFVQSADLGFDDAQMLVIDNFGKVPNRDSDYVVRQAIEDLPGVAKVGGTLESMLGLRGNATGSIRLAESSTAVPSLAHIASEDFFDAFGLEFVEGQNFTRGPRDFTHTILNETAVRALGIEGSAVGRKVVSYGERTVVGVVKDFHPASFHHEILPYSFSYSPQAMLAVVRLSGSNIQQTISQIESTWKAFVPDVPMDYYFLDSAIDQQYRSEQRFNVLFSVMTGLALVIAGLGLFGLVAFTAEQRTKEIGVRKVLGASIANLVALLSGDFMKLVFLANLIAWPIAYVAMNVWLGNFAYRIDIGFRTFAIAGLGAMIMALCTVSYQAVRAASANPVDSLRHE